MVHETGHYWLSPSDLMIRMAGRSVPLLTLDETTTELNANRPLTTPGLMGREDSHWSAYFQADDSVMDGVGWTRNTDEGGYARWTNRMRTVRLQPPNLPAIEFSGAFNDLELTIMGLKRPDEAYGTLAAASTG